MKFICLGYYSEDTWGSMTPEQQNALMDECFEYDDDLRRRGHFVGGEALQSAHSATTVRWSNGKAVVTDGPYAETKEQIGGILFLEARDMDHAVQLMSKHPGVKNGPFEIRPTADLSAMLRECEKRRDSKQH
ncbi:MAG TPA: YciI family protein [Kiritimatiellia bacterium]|nr:YciI family protein [Kiritimatiellia bacterium]